MLPAAARMRASKCFDATVRDGVRAGRGTLVVHAKHADDPDEQEVRVGFVVSKKVGNAVVRNRVKRRLRHLVAAQLSDTPGGVCLVVRALPAAADEANPLAADLTGAWRSSLHRLGVGS